MLNLSGIYGANVPSWPERLWRLVGIGEFNWAVVRTDCNPTVARRLRDAGIEVILQLPDGFNRDPHQNPAAWVERCRHAAIEFGEFSHIICLDNEPNLCQGGSGSWYAEQFCRWYRAVLALWRFHDPGGKWTVLFPALSPGTQLHPKLWLDINVENVRESDALASHSYWPGSIPPGVSNLDIFHVVIHDLAPNKDIYILEYGSPSTVVSDEAKAEGYVQFLRRLPPYVKSACMFILGGTPEWHDWFLTDTIARRLGAI